MCFAHPQAMVVADAVLLGREQLLYAALLRLHPTDQHVVYALWHLDKEVQVA